MKLKVRTTSVMRLADFQHRMLSETHFECSGPEDLTWINEYQLALDERCEAYFFMRGIEGHLNGRREHPIYRYAIWAQKLWEYGRDFAQVQFSALEYKPFDGPDAAWIASFMAGAYPNNSFGSNHYWAELFGLYARLYFEEVIKDNPMSRHLKPAHCVNEEPTQICKSKGTAEMTQLYKVEGTKKMGERVGEDSDGNIVLKFGLNDFEAFPAEKVSKVMPHTIRLLGSSFDRHFKCAKSLYMKGDILAVRTNVGLEIAEVMDVDTGNEDAKDLPKDKIRGFVIKQPRTTSATRKPATKSTAKKK